MYAKCNKYLLKCIAYTDITTSSCCTLQLIFSPSTFMLNVFHWHFLLPPSPSFWQTTADMMSSCLHLSSVCVVSWSAVGSWEFLEWRSWLTGRLSSLWTLLSWSWWLCCQFSSLSLLRWDIVAVANVVCVSTRPIDRSGGIMFSGCPSVCVCARAWARHCLTGLSLTSSLLLLCLYTGRVHSRKLCSGAFWLLSHGSRSRHWVVSAMGKTQHC